MIYRQPLALYADRYTGFEQSIRFRGIDLSGFFFRLQVREYPDRGGAALIDLMPAPRPSDGLAFSYAGSETIQAHIDAGRLQTVPKGYVASDILAMTVLTVTIGRAAIDAIYPPGTTDLRIGGNVTLHWDLIASKETGVPQRLLEGPFVIRAGVTQ